MTTEIDVESLAAELSNNTLERNGEIDISIERAKRILAKHDLPPPDNNRELGMFLAGIEIGRHQMRNAILHAILVDNQPTDNRLKEFDEGL